MDYWVILRHRRVVCREVVVIIRKGFRSAVDLYLCLEKVK